MTMIGMIQSMQFHPLGPKLYVESICAVKWREFLLKIYQDQCLGLISVLKERKLVLERLR